MPHFEIIRTDLQDDTGETVTSYGISGGGIDYPDLTFDRERAQRLVGDLNELQPEQCHLDDIVLDFTEEYRAR